VPQPDRLQRELTPHVCRYTKFALAPPPDAKTTTANCFCLNTKSTVSSTVEDGSCSWPCPQDATQRCGYFKQVRRAAPIVRYSVYEVYDLDQKVTQCKLCPFVVGALSVEKSATCYGGFFPPIADKDYWASPQNPYKFFRCLTFKGCIGGKRFGSTQFGERVEVARCGEGYDPKSTMCASCSTGFASGSTLLNEGGKCVKCPHERGLGVAAYAVYLFMPVMMFLGWYPGIYWFLAEFPTSFSVITYIQITGALGGFTVKWHPAVKLILKIMNVVNFDATLFFFECSLSEIGKSYLFNYLLIMLLPFLYAAKYFFDYKYNHMYGDQTTTWNSFVKNALFLTNLLFLPVLGQCFLLFSCGDLGNGTQYNLRMPATECYSGGHLAAVFIMPISFLLIVVGWPLAICTFYYVGYKNHLLDHPQFAGTIGFLYLRSTPETSWHMIC
jgi:hypothetical protein